MNREIVKLSQEDYINLCCDNNFEGEIKNYEIIQEELGIEGDDFIERIVIFRRKTDGKYFKTCFNQPLAHKYNVSFEELNEDEYCTLEEVFPKEITIIIYE